MLFHCPEYNTDLKSFGMDKPFALDRGQLVLEALKSEFGDTIKATRPAPITLEDARLVHTQRYLQSLSLESTWKEIMEVTEEDYDAQTASRPFPELIADILLKSGGTLDACRHAVAHGMAANLGGGYHHAFPDQGRGFCVLHDIAIAIRKLQNESVIKTALVVDLDFHQGDGTAVVFQGDPTVFTFSVHSKEGWPEEKSQSDLDIEIGEGDCSSYQSFLESGLLQCLEQLTPDLAVFVAGSDPYELDVLPGTRFMNLSLEQLRKRDEFVIDTFADRKIPLAMVFAGGYGPDVWKVHLNAVRHLLLRSGITTGTGR